MYSKLDLMPVQIITVHVIYNSPYKYWPDENDHSIPIAASKNSSPQYFVRRRNLLDINVKYRAVFPIPFPDY